MNDQWINTCLASFDVCRNISNSSTSKLILMSLISFDTVYEGRTVKVIFFFVAPGILLNTVHCADDSL